MSEDFETIINSHIGDIHGSPVVIVTLREEKTDGSYSLEFLPIPMFSLLEIANCRAFRPTILYHTPTAGHCNYAELLFDYATPPELVRAISGLSRTITFALLAVVCTRLAKDAANAR